MNRELLEQMTKEELLELASRQDEAINRLDEQRYNASAVIDHLVGASHELHNLRYHDAERSVCQDRLDDWVREMYMKHPLYLVSAEKVDCVGNIPPMEWKKGDEDKVPNRSAVILNLASMRDEARMNGYDGYVKTLSSAIELLEEADNATRD